MEIRLTKRNCSRISVTTSFALFMACLNVPCHMKVSVQALSLHPTRGRLLSVPSTCCDVCISGSSSSSLLFQRKSIIHPRGRQRPDQATTCMSSTMSHADLAVRLDQPVLSPTACRSATSYMWKSILAVLVSDVFKTACVAFLIAFFITFISKSSKQIKKGFNPLVSSINRCIKITQGHMSRIKESFKKESVGIPMEFTDGDGWGVCTLASKKQVGRSQYTRYEFKLPKADNILQLALGQKLTLCTLDSDDNVAKKSFFVFSPKNTKGHFSIVASKESMLDERELSKRKSRGETDFMRVLNSELEVGDEIALQPGARTLDYKGEYLPVTDMVYFASGDGIVPVIDQVKSVLPPGSSSVKGVSVIWTNDDEKDFDIALSTLEDEYFKYSTKLAVSCVVDEGKRSLEDNNEVHEAVTPFTPGTMAVVSGPRATEARSVLLRKGYPDNCICILPSDD